MNCRCLNSAVVPDFCRLVAVFANTFTSALYSFALKSCICALLMFPVAGSLIRSRKAFPAVLRELYVVEVIGPFSFPQRMSISSKSPLVIVFPNLSGPAVELKALHTDVSVGLATKALAPDTPTTRKAAKAATDTVAILRLILVGGDSAKPPPATMMGES
jgi:hypothetical protein